MPICRCMSMKPRNNFFAHDTCGEYVSLDHMMRYDEVHYIRVYLVPSTIDLFIVLLCHGLYPIMPATYLYYSVHGVSGGKYESRSG